MQQSSLGVADKSASKSIRSLHYATACLSHPISPDGLQDRGESQGQNDNVFLEWAECWEWFWHRQGFPCYVHATRHVGQLSLAFAFAFPRLITSSPTSLLSSFSIFFLLLSSTGSADERYIIVLSSRWLCSTTWARATERTRRPLFWRTAPTSLFEFRQQSHSGATHVQEPHINSKNTPCPTRPAKPAQNSLASCNRMYQNTSWRTRKQCQVQARTNHRHLLESKPCLEKNHRRTSNLVRRSETPFKSCTLVEIKPKSSQASIQRKFTVAHWRTTAPLGNKRWVPRRPNRRTVLAQVHVIMAVNYTCQRTFDVEAGPENIERAQVIFFGRLRAEGQPRSVET